MDFEWISIVTHSHVFTISIDEVKTNLITNALSFYSSVIWVLCLKTQQYQQQQRQQHCSTTKSVNWKYNKTTKSPSQVANITWIVLNTIFISIAHNNYIRNGIKKNKSEKVSHGWKLKVTNINSKLSNIDKVLELLNDRRVE